MHILLTGGGTAGHVLPNLAIADAINDLTKDAKLSYIGSKHGLEKDLVQRKNIRFEAIQTGKLRRYFDIKNFLDLSRIPIGTVQAYSKIKRLHPDVVFSKGGYVAFPVVFAAWLNRIPVIIHESDSIPGLATKLSAPFAKKILTAYNSTAIELPKYKKKIEFVGNPIRKEIASGSISKAKRITGFKGEKPVLLVMGGSSGAQQLNTIVKKEKERLTETFDVIHIFGKGNGKKRKEKSYFAAPYLHEELKDIYEFTSIAISRAGASALAELEALQIPTLLYPLGTKSSRGDQLANAQEMSQRYKIFNIADESKSALSQLIFLPKRPKKKLENLASKKVALILLNECS